MRIPKHKFIFSLPPKNWDLSHPLTLSTPFRLIMNLKKKRKITLGVLAVEAKGQTLTFSFLFSLTSNPARNDGIDSTGESLESGIRGPSTFPIFSLFLAGHRVQPLRKSVDSYLLHFTPTPSPLWSPKEVNHITVKGK